MTPSIRYKLIKVLDSQAHVNADSSNSLNHKGRGCSVI